MTAMNAMTNRIDRQRGFSIVEMMVALAIGMGLSLVIGQLFLGSRQSYSTQDESARMQENARFAMDLMTKTLRMSGYKRFDSTGVFDSTNPALAATNGGDVNASDRLTVRFYGSDLTDGSAADNTVFDCVGNAIRLNSVAIVTYYVAADAANANEPTLFCDSDPGTGTVTSYALVPGVESMQLLFGEDTNADNNADRYLPAGTVGLTMDNVIAVRIGLLMRSPGAAAAASAIDSRVYNIFGQSYSPANAAPTGDAGAMFNSGAAELDFRLRRIFQATVAIRSRVN